MLLDYSEKKLILKFLYWGAGESGKTTNLSFINQSLSPENNGNFIKLENENKSTLFFDFLSLNLGIFKGLNVFYNLYTVPGQQKHKNIASLQLKGADGIVFVADSRAEKREENIESYKNLIRGLDNAGIDHKKIPIVFQYNKRDHKKSECISRINKDININNKPIIEASAINGNGVFATLKTLSNLYFTTLN